jgi:hypothetical protein
MPENPRITLIARNSREPAIDWNYDRFRQEHVDFLGSMAATKLALETAMSETGREIGLDIERVIIDRTGDADDFLNLMAALPGEMTADIMFVRDDGNGFLSAMGRGGDRLLYAVDSDDIRFYLEANDLVTARVALRLSA